MTFTFGGVNFDSLPGLNAIRRETPQFSGVAIDTVAVQGRERRSFLGVTRPTTSITYELYLEIPGSTSEEDLAQRFDLYGRYLDPTYGPRRLILNDRPGWFWLATVAQEVVWTQLMGGEGCSKYIYSAAVTFETVEDAAARQVTPVSHLFEETNTTIPLQGTTTILPRFEIRGAWPATRSLVLILDSNNGDEWRVSVQGPVTNAQRLILDYDTMDFGLFTPAGVKLLSVVPRMSGYSRPPRHPAEAHLVARYGWSGSGAAGVMTSARLFPNFRRS